jgi:Flp pilus assembly protein TadD
MSRFVLLMLLAATLIAPTVARAMGGDQPPAASSVDPDFAAGKQAIEKEDWPRAIESFAKAAAKDARNADIQNYLGYAYRKSGQLDLAFKHYEQALAIDPRHRGAHEYMGEAYLMVNNLAKAEEHRNALDQLCFFPCKEYTELKEKIAAYKGGAK